MNEMTSPVVCSFIFHLMVLAVAKTKTNPVSVEISQVPIVFGANAILFCNLSKVSGCCSNTVTWMRNYQVIVHHGVSVNASKYKQTQTTKGVSLQITQFEYTDMRVKYSCFYKFLSASIFLEMDENTYEKHPKDKSVSQIEELNNKKQRIYTINLVFEEVYPKPTCRILSDGYEFKTESHSLKNGMFYNASIRINVCYTERNCGKNITGVCSVGKFNMTWSSGPPLNCYDSHSVASDGIETSVVIISTVFVIVIILTAVAVCYQKYKTKQKERDNTEDEPLLLWDGHEQGRNCYQERHWFPRCSTKNFAKLIKENETCFTEKVLAYTNTKISERRLYFHDLGKYLENIGFHTIPQKEVKQYCKDLSSNFPMQKLKDILLFLKKFK